MPGIAGVLYSSGMSFPSSMISKMIATMNHESFYVCGTYDNNYVGCCIGYCTIEKTFSDCMPIFNERKDIVLFLTGECYPDPEQIQLLRTRGHSFSEKDASYLVHAYEEFGDKLFKELNGWFNGIIIEISKRKAHIFNDRFGIRRLYTYEHRDFFAFASEAKALLRVFPELRQADPVAIGEFIAFDCVLGNKTYFPKIYLLPPASVWEYQNGNLKKKSYLDMSELENQPKLSLEQYREELSCTFTRILKRYFNNYRQSIGLGLTGGLDTRSIIACRNPEPGELPCYTFTGSFKDIIDAKIASRVAEICCQSYQKLILEDSNLIKNYGELAQKASFISDGLNVVTFIDAIYFNRMARSIAPIRMTGKYGSQVLKGVYGFKPRLPILDIISQDFSDCLSAAVTAVSSYKRMHQLTFLLQGIIPWWWNGILTLELSQIEIRSPFLDNDLIKVVYRAPKLPYSFGKVFELELIAKHKPELLKVPTTGTHGGSGYWPIPMIRKSMISFKLYLDKIYNREELPYNTTHLLAKLDKTIIARYHLDRIFSGAAEFRRYRKWYRDELSGYIKDILLSKRTLNRPYWNKKGLIRVVNDHIKGKGNYLREIRKILQIELLHQSLIEKSDW